MIRLLVNTRRHAAGSEVAEEVLGEDFVQRLLAAGQAERVTPPDPAAAALTAVRALADAAQLFQGAARGVLAAAVNLAEDDRRRVATEAVLACMSVMEPDADLRDLFQLADHEEVSSRMAQLEARLAHTQEGDGSNPSPAPSSDAGAGAAAATLTDGGADGSSPASVGPNTDAGGAGQQNADPAAAGSSTGEAPPSGGAATAAPTNTPPPNAGPSGDAAGAPAPAVDPAAPPQSKPKPKPAKRGRAGATAAS